MGVFQLKDGWNGGTDNQARVFDNGDVSVRVSNPSGGSGWANFAQSTPKLVAVSNVSTELLAANPLRVFATLSNNSSQTIYFQYSNAAAWQTGYRLSPGGIWIINTIELFLGSVNAITQTGIVNIGVIEGVV